MIVCQCTGTTDRDIRRLQSRGANTVADIADVSGAGHNCDSCRDEIGRLLGQADGVRSAERFSRTG